MQIDYLEAGGRALGGVISKIHHLKDFGIKTFEKLFTSCVVPVLDYSSSIRGYKDFACLNQIQNKAFRYFLGVHKFAPTLAINGEVGWVNAKERRWCNMIRYWNKRISMDDTRIQLGLRKMHEQLVIQSEKNYVSYRTRDQFYYKKHLAVIY